MVLDDEIDLNEDDSENESIFSPSSNPGVSGLDSRRLIERHMELKRLREQLEDPGFIGDLD